MKKAIAILTVLFVIPSTLALQVDGPENSNDLTVLPDERQSYTFEFSDWGEQVNESEVEVQVTGKGEYTQILTDGYSSTVNNGGDSVSLSLLAPSSDDIELPYTETLQITFEVQDENGSTTTEITKELNITTKIPYEVLNEEDVEKDDNYYNTSHQFTFNDVKYNISEISDQLVQLTSENNQTQTVELGSPQITNQNNVRITLQSIVDNAYAKLVFEAKQNHDVGYSKDLFTTTTEEPEQCVLGIQTRSPIVRGQDFSFTTINENTGETVENVNVVIEGVRAGVGVIAEGKSFAAGRGSVTIPETMYQEHSEATEVSITLTKDSGCQNKLDVRVPIEQSWSSYANDNENYQLELVLENHTFYQKVSGKVQTQEGDNVGSGILEVTMPDGDINEVGIEENQFSFTPERSGEYELMATKTGFVDSEKKVVQFIDDKDGDGVPNSQDECPDTEGVEANNGCPRIEVRLSINDIESGDAVSSNELRPGKRYAVEVVNENNTVVDFNGNATVEELDTTLNFTDGEINAPGRERGVRFSSTGEYTLALNSEGFEDGEFTVNVANAPLVPEDLPVMPMTAVILVLILLVAGGMYYSGSGNSLGSNGNGMDPGALEDSTTLDPNKSGPDNR